MQTVPAVRTARIAVYNIAYTADRPFSYLIPEDMYEAAVCGVRVIVPFGRGGRKRVGLILSVADEVPSMKLKSVLSVVDREPVVSPEMMRMILWLKENTFCTFYEALRTILPSGMNISINEKYSFCEDADFTCLTDEERNLAGFLKNAASEREFDELLESSSGNGKREVIESLVEKGVIRRVSETSQRVKDKTMRMIKLSETYVNEPAMFRLTPKQKQVIKLLEENGSASVKEVCYICSVTDAVIKNLIKNGACEEFSVPDYRLPGEEKYEPDALGRIVLSEAQNRVFSRVSEVISEGRPHCFLLHGVTGSGKTSVFIKLIEKTLSEGKTAMLLIPEISLTPQIVENFCRLFGGTVSVIHSNLSLGQRLEEYRRIEAGLSKIVVGTRSAVFAPLENIGLIIMDEEGERSYKSDSAPRYTTSAVAKERCRTHGAVLLLGSATPSVESYYYASKGVYELLELTERFNKSDLPHVEIVDMNAERANGNTSEFSEVLVHEIRRNLEAGEQTILLLNRRGYHTVISCAGCSSPVYCPNCSIPYTYHKANDSLVCHYCGSIAELPEKCPGCGGTVFKQMGFGTQKMEEQLEALFPDARILRMDADTTFSRYAYEKNFKDFADKKYDIMVGTQMIGKGLDFPDVTLVGIVTADKSLFSGDFRSYERTFSLITQVAGRSGRGGKKGRAYLQTFMPDHYVLNLAAAQNYAGFYKEEIALRKTLIFPPVCDICVIGLSSVSDAAAAAASAVTLKIIKDVIKAEQIKFPLRVLGPVQSGIAKMNGKYRYRLILKCKNNKETRSFIRRVLLKTAEYREYSNVNIYADMNGDIV
ncbi:MAG: primosomal protein N' [Oscillospiraceae bacterium]|nr:primosomal protein N' [Oscillospiraceae bacterium]MBR6836442.1 primosomal protein N' [Oscillospiraceae bacterium]